MKLLPCTTAIFFLLGPDRSSALVRVTTTRMQKALGSSLTYVKVEADWSLMENRKYATTSFSEELLSETAQEYGKGNLQQTFEIQIIILRRELQVQFFLL